MTKNLPTHHPAEIIEISPEALEVANCYLQHQNIAKVAEELGVSQELVTDTLRRREVKAYVDQVFFDLGFNNRFLMRKAMDAIIQKKFQEMDEAGVGSSKDIVEILALSHKMTVDILDREIALEKARAANIKSQVNVQINENQNAGGSNYANLIEKLVNAGSK